MNGTLPWYIARSAGLVAWALLSASVIWGLTMSNRARPFGHRPRPAWMLDLHRWLGGLASVFVGVHIVAILADSYVNFSIVSVLVPFTASWRSMAVAWGVVAMWLLVAVELTSLARRHLPRKAWRLIHGASFPLFGLATLHAFTAGTDAGSLLFIGVAVPVILTVAGLTAKRVMEVTDPDRQPDRQPERPLVRAEADPVVLPRPDLVRKLARYASASVIATATSMTVLGTLVATGALAAGWANVVATGVGTVPSFELNRRWVWGRIGRRSVLREVGPFSALSFTGLALSTLAVSLAARWATRAQLGTTGRTLASEGANVATFAALWVVQYVLLDRVLFRSRRESCPDELVTAA